MAEFSEFMRLQHDDSVLALEPVPHKRLLLTGCQDSVVRVWNTTTFACAFELKGHSRGIRCLRVCGNLVLSSSGDNTIRLWDADAGYACVAVVAGPEGIVLRFSVVARPVGGSAHVMLMAGCQNTAVAVATVVLTPGEPCATLSPEWTFYKGHRGFVYATYCRPVGDALEFYSGSGDATIRVWSASFETGLKEVGVLSGHKGSVYTVTATGRELVSGSQDCTIRIWDLDTKYCKHVLVGHTQEVLSVTTSTAASGENLLCSASADKSIRLWSLRSLLCLQELTGHEGIVLTTSLCGTDLFTGGADSTARVWSLGFSDVRAGTPALPGSGAGTPLADGVGQLPLDEDSLIKSLRAFVALQTVSSSPKLRSTCWEGARYTQQLLNRVGATTELVQAVEGCNPVVFARLGSDPKLETVVIHGHYDVQPAGDEAQWKFPPFTLTGQDGFLFGRGVSDCKGAVLVAMFAAALAHRPTQAFAGVLSDADKAGCNVNIVFVLEGEGENSSLGFQETVTRHKAFFDGATLIMNNNSTWLGQTLPCLTYGLRGRILFDLQVSGPRADLHSGVDGGVVREPMLDLIDLLGTAYDASTGNVLVDGFYDGVRALTPYEGKLFEDLGFDVPEYLKSLGVCTPYNPWVEADSPLHALCAAATDSDATRLLVQRWRMPSFTVHELRGSSASTSVIPAAVTATVSVRTVPDQDTTALEAAIVAHFRSRFAASGSRNDLQVKPATSAKWWYQDPASPHYAAAAAAISVHWGCTPAFVCEGGTQRVTPFLEDVLGAPGLHLPLAQADNGAHLANERIRIVNLIKGVHVLRTLFCTLGRREAE